MHAEARLASDVGTHREGRTCFEGQTFVVVAFQIDDANHRFRDEGFCRAGCESGGSAHSGREAHKVVFDNDHRHGHME